MAYSNKQTNSFLSSDINGYEGLYDKQISC